MLPIAPFALFLLGCCAYSLWRGGAPERWAAGLEIAAACATMAIRCGRGTALGFADFPPGIFAVEGLFTFSLVLIALTADRVWPMAAAGIQLAYMIVHLSRVVAPNMLPYDYLWGMQVWAIPKLLLFVVGALRHQQRLVRRGRDPSWSRSRAPG